jgi:hypothetical protein
MRKVEILIKDKTAKIVESKSDAIKDRYDNIFYELNSTPKLGKYYQEYKGERLRKLEKKLKIDFEIHSIELADRLRLVYELYSNESVCHITDIANHEYRGKPYAKQFSFSLKS